MELEEQLLDLQEKRIDIEQKRIELELRKLKLFWKSSRKSKSKRDSSADRDDSGAAMVDQFLGPEYDECLASGMSAPDDDDFDIDDGDQDSEDDDEAYEKKDKKESKRSSLLPKRTRDGPNHSTSQKSMKGLENGSGSADDVPQIPSQSSKSPKRSPKPPRKKMIDAPYIDQEVSPGAYAASTGRRNNSLPDVQDGDISPEVTQESTRRRRMPRRGSAPAISSFEFDFTNVSESAAQEVARKQALLREFESTAASRTAKRSGDDNRRGMQDSDTSLDATSVMTEKRSNKK